MVSLTRRPTLLRNSTGYISKITNLMSLRHMKRTWRTLDTESSQSRLRTAPNLIHRSIRNHLSHPVGHQKCLLEPDEDLLIEALATPLDATFSAAALPISQEACKPPISIRLPMVGTLTFITENGSAQPLRKKVVGKSPSVLWVPNSWMSVRSQTHRHSHCRLP